ncbi:MAG: DUF308 domain-containing protein [Clostridia bacterium]|nr:DUF308 domain-containing protein [Clostridia bacterium]
MAKKTDSGLFSSILYILIGILVIIFRAETLNWAMTIAGIFFLISGILELVKKNWVGGGVSIVIGIAILVLGWLAATIVLLVLGILIAVKGIVALIDAFRKKNTKVLDLIFPILTVVVGLVLAFGNGLDILLIIGGALLVADGALGLINSLKK